LAIKGKEYAQAGAVYPSVVHYIFFFGSHGIGGAGSLVDLVYFLDGFGWCSKVDSFCWCRQMDGLDGMGIHNSYYV